MNRQHIYPLVWHQDHLLVIDQTRLPRELSIIEVRRFDDLIEAIDRGIIQGADLLQLAAGYGLCLLASDQSGDRSLFLDYLGQGGQRTEGRSRATVALGLFRQELDRLVRTLTDTEGTVPELKSLLWQLVQDSHRSGLQRCYALAEAALDVLPRKTEALGLLVYGNGGSLATVGYGTSLGVVRRLWEQERLGQVYVAEVRPQLQGAQVAAWECAQEGIAVTVVADNAVAMLMQQGEVDAVIVGATAIAANGDVAHVMGTYGVALAAQTHGVPFVVVAPQAVIQSDRSTGQDLDLVELPGEIWSQWQDLSLYPSEVAIYSRGEDLTPHKLVTAIVTENGVYRPKVSG